MDINTLKLLLEDMLCDQQKMTKAELLQGIDYAVDALKSIQESYVLLKRDVIKETR